MFSEQYDVIWGSRGGVGRGREGAEQLQLSATFLGNRCWSLALLISAQSWLSCSAPGPRTLCPPGKCCWLVSGASAGLGLQWWAWTVCRWIWSPSQSGWSYKGRLWAALQWAGPAALRCLAGKPVQCKSQALGLCDFNMFAFT